MTFVMASKALVDGYISCVALSETASVHNIYKGDMAGFTLQTLSSNPASHHFLVYK